MGLTAASEFAEDFDLAVGHDRNELEVLRDQGVRYGYNNQPQTVLSQNIGTDTEQPVFKNGTFEDVKRTLLNFSLIVALLHIAVLILFLIVSTNLLSASGLKFSDASYSKKLT